MKTKFILVLIILTAVIPFQLSAQNALDVFKQEGIASWYGKEFEGRPTASGEIFDSSQLTAAHPSLPFGTMLIVTNQHNNKKVTVRVNDRGPFVPARIIDVSRAAAEQLDMIVTGTAPVTVVSADKMTITTAAVGAQILPFVTAEPSVILKTELPNIKPISNPLIETSDSVFISQTSALSSVTQFKLTPKLDIEDYKNYRLQIGSFKIARNAVDAFERIKNSGLTPAYERFKDSDESVFYRVVLSGVMGINLNTVTEKLSAAGFKEALIREEN